MQKMPGRRGGERARDLLRRRQASITHPGQWLKGRGRGLSKRLALFCASCAVLLGSATPPDKVAAAAREPIACQAGGCAGDGGSRELDAAAAMLTAPTAVSPPGVPAPAAPAAPAPSETNALPPASPVDAAASGAAPRGYMRDDRWDFGPDETVRVVVSLPRQRAYVFRGLELIDSGPVSTGRPGYRTPAGRFPILQKRVRHYSNLYDNAPMPYMQRLTHDGIALHAGDLPGYPASHGCIRLPWDFARRLYRLTNYSSEVIITRHPTESSREALNLL
jgi:lipoprotein-anchoring transpeptidase ErfK/SrfK